MQELVEKRPAVHVVPADRVPFCDFVLQIVLQLGVLNSRDDISLVVIQDSDLKEQSNDEIRKPRPYTVLYPYTIKIKQLT